MVKSATEISGHQHRRRRAIAVAGRRSGAIVREGGDAAGASRETGTGASARSIAALSRRRGSAARRAEPAAGPRGVHRAAVYWSDGVRARAQLVVAISSRALFDFEEENRVFETANDRAYMKMQLERLEAPAKPGVAFPLVQKLAGLQRGRRAGASRS